MRFILDAMLPPAARDFLVKRGHEATTPTDLGAANLSDAALASISAAEGWVIVTENARDFANVETCTILLVRKRWWLGPSLARELATALDR